MPVRYDHIHLVVSDVPAAVAWFKEMFGFREGYLDLEPSYFDGTEQHYLDVDGVGMNVRGRTNGEQLAPDNLNRWGVNHFSLRVPDVPAKIEELRAKGVKVLLEPEHEGPVCWAFVQGPDNIKVELIHRKNLA